MTTTHDDEADFGGYATCVSEVLMGAWGTGMMHAATGGDRGANPHAVESHDWQEWMRGFQSWEDAPKFTLEVADGLFGAVTP